ncbi:MAG: tRNA (adenosine(37)-N6)-threonylcarbamoyltransferase complex ATPase subunit type 1 TsaE [Roseobacter sp.]
MPHLSYTFQSASPDETATYAAQLAADLMPGDVILLAGDVGAGKTHFARHLIQSILVEPEDIPSPTFTLVQVYETTRGPVWHSDLYRIGSTFEIEELGLLEAFDTAICLIEWPDRLGTLAPDTALTLNLSQQGGQDGRRIEVTATSHRWVSIMERWVQS